LNGNVEWSWDRRLFLELLARMEDTLRQRLHESAEVQQFIAVQTKLAEVDLVMKDLARQRQRLQLDREEAFHRLNGETLTIKLSEIALSEKRIDDRVSQSEVGVQALRDEADRLRKSAEALARRSLDSDFGRVESEIKKNLAALRAKLKEEAVEPLEETLNALMEQRVALVVIQRDHTSPYPTVRPNPQKIIDEILEECEKQALETAQAKAK
jgi:hypothetical protein